MIGDELRQRLIHADGARGHVRADKGQSGQTQKALHRAVLAVLAVQHGEHDVDVLAHHAVALKAEQPLTAHGRNRRAAIFRAGLPDAAGQRGIVLAAVEDPVPALRDADREQIIFLFIQLIQHGLGRAQRNLVLRRHPAEQNTNAELFHKKPPKSGRIPKISEARRN